MIRRSLFQDNEGVKSYFPTTENTDYIALAGTTSSYAIKTGYTPPSVEITIEQWLRPDAASSKTMSSFSYAHSVSDNSVLLYNVNNNITPHIKNATATTGLKLPAGVFSHLAMTWRSSDGLLQVFIDGIKKYETKNIAKGFVIPSGGAVVLGQEQDSVGGSFQSAQAFMGGISETRVWNKVLTEDEIQQMMYVSPIGTEENLVSFWSFSEGAGNKVLDKTSRAQDLTLVGATWKTGGVSLKSDFEWEIINDASFNKDMFDGYGLQSMSLLDRRRSEIKLPTVKDGNKFSSEIDLSNILSVKVERK